MAQLRHSRNPATWPVTGYLDARLNACDNGVVVAALVAVSVARAGILTAPKVAPMPVLGRDLLFPGRFAGAAPVETWDLAILWA